MKSRKCRNNLKYLYGITIDDYNAMLVKQNYNCAICERHCKELTKSLCVDHNHETGQVRGLLCDWCNRAIGWLSDDPDKVEAALKYLRTKDERYYTE